MPRSRAGAEGDDLWKKRPEAVSERTLRWGTTVTLWSYLSQYLELVKSDAQISRLLGQLAESSHRAASTVSDYPVVGIGSLEKVGDGGAGEKLCLRGPDLFPDLGENRGRRSGTSSEAIP